MEPEAKPVAEFINKIFANISPADVENSYRMESCWKETVCSIKSAVNPFEGKNLYDHSRIIDLKNGTLLVEADHPGWIEMFQMHKDYIKRGLTAKIPELGIQNIVFRLSGTDAMLHGTADDDEERTRRNILKMEERFEKEAEYAGKSSENGGNGQKKKELPPELAGLFENLRQNMLTNSDK